MHILLSMRGDFKGKLVKYFESLGIEVCTDTDAHGHQGYFSDNKIEISSSIKKRKLVPTLLHEFSHYIHTKIEQDLLQTGGNISAVFNLSDADINEEDFQQELFEVTNFVDKGSLCTILKSCKEKLNNKINKLETKIKRDCSEFKINKNIKDSSLNAFQDNLAYKELLSVKNEKQRICRCINKYIKYYSTPAELFARFVEGLFIDSEKVKNIAPNAYKRFFNLLEKGYYHELKNIFQILSQSAKI